VIVDRDDSKHSEQDVKDVEKFVTGLSQVPNGSEQHEANQDGTDDAPNEVWAEALVVGLLAVEQRVHRVADRVDYCIREI